MDIYGEALAGTLRAAQARARMTDIALAEKSGIKVVTLRRYLKGERDAPSSALYKIALALGMRVADLVEDATQHAQQQE